MPHVSRARFSWLLGAVACLSPSPLTASPTAAAETQPDENQQLAAALAEQEAFHAAAQRAAPAIVQIRTIGGLEQVDDRVLAQGPTTGLVVREDGYIVSSAFNFAQQPSSILVRLPDGSQAPAELVGRDSNRMLVLLKIDPRKSELVPAEAAPLDEVQVGQWAIALGRTFDASRPNVSVGVISAKNRMLGRAVQTDAKVSAANYGGPLVNIRGQTVGVLVPMAPSAGPASAEVSEVAGADSYDSGIAFAVPLETILANLDRWIAAGELHRGLLGVGLAEGSAYAVEPRITSIWPGSPADDAGWQNGDLIVAVEGRPVATQMQLRMRVAPRYAGDSLAVRIRRGEGEKADEIETEVTLAAKLPPFRQGFLGVLPERPHRGDKQADEKADAVAVAGVRVRTVWPDGPAAAAGVKVGDRLVQLNDAKITSLADAAQALAGEPAGKPATVAVVRGDERLELEAKLGPEPTVVLASANLPAPPIEADVAATATDELELINFKLPEFPATARCMPPTLAGDLAAPGLLLWLGTNDPDTTEQLARSWRKSLSRAGAVLVVAEPGDESGWSGDDAEYLARLLPAVAARFHADSRRTVIAGEAKGGQLALALALKLRGQLSGVAAVAAPLPRTATIPQNAPGAGLAVLMVATENSPFSALVRRDAAQLAEAGFPVSEATRRGTTDRDGLLDAETRLTIARWIDGLDRF